MRYGTVPIVRRSGGTADSVVDAVEHTIECETATGFSFIHPCADDLIACVRRTLELYRQPIVWRKIQICAMQQDFGWKRPARAYFDLYRTLVRPPTEESIAAKQKASKTMSLPIDHAEANYLKPAA
jgi:starch synthase